MLRKLKVAGYRKNLVIIEKDEDKEGERKPNAVGIRESQHKTGERE